MGQGSQLGRGICKKRVILPYNLVAPRRLARAGDAVATATGSDCPEGIPMLEKRPGSLRLFRLQERGANPGQA